MMRFSFSLLLTLFAAPLAHAACSNPEGDAGRVIYNTTYKVMQYCNGTNWINTGAVIANAAQGGCSNPEGQGGRVIFNASQGVVQFCNGSNWVDTACARDRKKNGSGCTGGGKAGTIRYVGGSVNELQFCDSTDWVAMGWPCGPEQALNVANVFSTDLYTGNGGIQTITNGIDLAGSGGLVWVKGRSAATNNILFDTMRGANNYLVSDGANMQANIGNSLSAFFANGFQIYDLSNFINENSFTYAAWTFRRAPKFFDVVTYTGNGVAGRTIAHNLGVEPGMVIVKRTSGVDDWWTWHRVVSKISSPYSYKGLKLNTTQELSTNYFGGDPTETDFLVSGNLSENSGSTNVPGSTYVAYLFAHDPSPEGMIQCGSYTGTGAEPGPLSTLGWEPQWVIIKRAAGAAGDWFIFDNARSTANPRDKHLFANLSDAEPAYTDNPIDFVSTGFRPTTSKAGLNGSGHTYIYCAIRAEGS